MKAEINSKKLVNGKTISQALGVCRTTIYLWTKDRKIPGYKIGRSIRYDLDEVLEIAKILN
ncbi:helix-turn-helix domain-containing protein [Sphingobacterium multivorum]|uniref:helix-turn-helix domain-containing protein n=1 Tax=Sphingobacterium multivorum TaxID=28454 RepID=UPI0028AE0719|nr:helix-turn-helix domain-containing protein [Sphingobacterium multivorum]